MPSQRRTQRSGHNPSDIEIRDLTDFFQVHGTLTAESSGLFLEVLRRLLPNILGLGRTSFGAYEEPEPGLTDSDIDKHTESFEFPEFRKGYCAIDQEEIEHGEGCRRIIQVMTEKHVYSIRHLNTISAPKGQEDMPRSHTEIDPPTARRSSNFF
jgi:hypothetical protein